VNDLKGQSRSLKSMVQFDRPYITSY